MKDIIQKVN